MVNTVGQYFSVHTKMKNQRRAWTKKKSLRSQQKTLVQVHNTNGFTERWFWVVLIKLTFEGSLIKWSEGSKVGVP